MQYWYESLAIVTTQFLSEAAIFLPRIAAALLIFIVGIAVARALKSLVIRLLELARVSSLVEKTPIEHFLKNADFGEKFEDLVGTIFYWLVMLVVIHTMVSVLGLASLSLLLERVLSYLPRVVSAVIVLFFGVLLAGLVESLVKGAVKSIGTKGAILLGKVASYLVITITVLAAVLELGIAREFILVLFVGFVTMISLGGALALGLGAKDVVGRVLQDWYKRLKREASSAE